MPECRHIVSVTSLSKGNDPYLCCDRKSLWELKTCCVEVTGHHFPFACWWKWMRREYAGALWHHNEIVLVHHSHRPLDETISCRWILLQYVVKHLWMKLIKDALKWDSRLFRRLFPRVHFPSDLKYSIKFQVIFQYKWIALDIIHMFL